MFSPADAKYIDGVVELHAQLNTAYRAAHKIASRYIPLSVSEINRYYNTGTFRVFVDSKDDREIYAPLKAYFIFGGYICRFLPITIELAALYPVRDLTGWDDSSKRQGLSSEELATMGIFDEELLFSLKKDSRVSYPLYNISEKNHPFDDWTKKLDDIGQPFLTFADIQSLSSFPLPNHILSSQYSLVGIQHYAPLTKLRKEIDCVLYAELSNPHDPCAIKVLRWFPQKRDEVQEKKLNIFLAKERLKRVQRNIIKYTDIMLETNGRVDYIDAGLRNYKQKESELKKIIDSENYVGDYFFELGYVSRQESSSLHSFMVENNSRILFGKCKDGRIAITGGINFLIDSEYNLPFCLSNLTIE